MCKISEWRLKMCAMHNACRRDGKGDTRLKGLNVIVMPADEKVNLREYKNLVETIAKVEYQKFSVSHLVELPELINIGNHTLYLLFKNSSPENYNTTYLSTAIKWAIRNEVRRRYNGTL